MARYTPMIEQYLEIKEQHRDAILFFRLGDFYEMFFEDAQLASRELDIVLTARDGGDGKVPMCGIPYHAMNNYVSRLISRGHKIAICEQVEDPREAKGIVQREVIRIITPGTVIEDNLLEENKNNYLVAIVEEQNLTGFAYTDISTGEFKVCEIAHPAVSHQVINELLRLAPAECLLAEYDSFTREWLNKPEGRMVISAIDERALNLKNALGILADHFQVASLEGFGLKGYTAGIEAAAAIILFLQETQKSVLKHLRSLSVYSNDACLEMDHTTRRNLELSSSLREARREGSLLGILDQCCTAMGKRNLKRWIEQPLKDIVKINTRLDAVQELKEDLALRSEIREILNGVYDLERLAAKIGGEIANPRDLLALKYSIDSLAKSKEVLQQAGSQLLSHLAGMDHLQDVYGIIEESIDEAAPPGIREGNIIKDGFQPEIDELKQLSRDGSSWLINYEGREKERTGIKYLKVSYNKVFGYYIEISKSNLHLVPPEYVRKQTLVNTERYITDELKQYEEKILGAREKLYTLEQQVFIEIRENLCQHLERIQDSAGKLAMLDVIASLAEVAYLNDYQRPQVDNSGVIEIRGGRHPVVEKNLQDSRFIPNDLKLNDSDNRFAIITGPNMGGKSTYMRQAALLVIMAQMGSFVPADGAHIGIADKIFTRVGATDDLAAGQSTFMVEMVEVANILNNAGSDSLIILDEIGRGTSTYDGLSIARAVSEYIHDKIGARSLFATHYHELTSLSDNFPGIFNLSVSVMESGDTVVFLKKVLPGKADRSYGVQVAALAGVPDIVVKRAGEILSDLEKTPVEMKESLVQLPLFPEENPWLEELEQLNLDSLSPREALNLLYRWKERK
ncbi:MAG: DNA mismatch repair protein MutS [Syntrophomonadaceae bacterium]|nr:DNA mismatch repair protein MutS [Syntrophomonadaceae bacterium]